MSRQHKHRITCCAAAGATAWLSIGIPTVPRKGGTAYLTVTIGDRVPIVL